MEESVENISAYEFQKPTGDSGNQENYKGLFPDFEGEGQDQECADAVNRNPRTECRATLEEVTLVDVTADCLVDEADDACNREDHHEQCDNLCRAFPGQSNNLTVFPGNHYTKKGRTEVQPL